jgi:hypothetical protein
MAAACEKIVSRFFMLLCDNTKPQMPDTLRAYNTEKELPAPGKKSTEYNI